jgi:hypothetical protein
VRTMTIILDELDYSAVQRCIARRMLFGRSMPGWDCKCSLLPDGDSDIAGALIAEICRGWEEMLDARL